MARIRTLKPGFFDHEGLASVSAYARLAFQGLWLHADREGRLKDQPGRLRVQIFPYEPTVNMDALLNDLARIGVVVRYEVAGVRYLEIPGFVEHQRPHPKEPASLFPPRPSTAVHGETRPAVEGSGTIPSSPVGREGKEISDLGRGRGPAEPPAPRASRPSSLIGRGEAVTFDAQVQKQHDKCHREVCAYWTTDARIQVCLPAAQVAQFAAKLVSVPEADRVPQVLAWARAHVPTVAELPANLFRYWDAQWDARGEQRVSAVPGVEETERLYLRRTAVKP